VGTKTGIGSLNLNSPVSNYSKLIASNRGLIGRKIHQINQSGNTLWVNTDAGIVVKKLSASDIIVKDPPVYITEYSINETNYLGNTNRVCSYNENNIKISFVGISYQSFGNLTYEYTLEGIDTKWNYTQNTTIQYPYLPPGNYTFRVKLAGNKSNPATVATLSFTITPPFWNTLLFKIAMVGMLLATVIAFFLYRIKRIKKADEEKIRITKMIAEMEAKAIRAQMNPHFIFNALNSVQNFILKNDRMQAQDYLAKFARLIRHVLDNSKQEMIPLHKEIEALTLYLQLEQLRIPQKFSFTIHCSPQIDIAQTQIPPLLMQPFVENALLHGITHKKDLTGIIHITIDKTTTQLICNIEDNGIGRKKSMAINAAKETLHESFGMSATKERIEILNLHHPNMASVRIIDKIDDANLATGTTVVITIPLILKPA
jgi:hypothetical protein